MLFYRLVCQIICWFKHPLLVAWQLIRIDLKKKKLIAVVYILFFVWNKQTRYDVLSGEMYRVVTAAGQSHAAASFCI